jgi:hypothetical protein
MRGKGRRVEGRRASSRAVRNSDGPSAVRVSSWNGLMDALFFESWRPDIGRFRSNHAFHGVPRARQPLTTGLSRLANAGVETHLLRNFRKYAPRAVVARDSLWNWLALGQHHGLPTRLLDWTYSPFVALHFATAAPDAFDVDGAVWCIDFVAANAYLPDALKRVLAAEGSNVFTAEMLDPLAGTLGDLEGLSDDPFLLFMEPPSVDDRIVNQFALLSTMSRADASLRSWLARRPDLARVIVVPAALKLEIRDKLDQANITERVLYPGLDGLARWLRRQYSRIGETELRRSRFPRPAPTTRARGSR